MRADEHAQIAQSRPNLMPTMNPWGLNQSSLGVGAGVVFTDPDLPGTITNKKQ